MIDYTDPDLQTWERIAAFDEQHGKTGLRVGNWIYYADGAVRDVNPQGALQEPLPNLVERYKCIIRHFEEKLRLKVNEFDAIRNGLLANENGWANEAENKRRLTACQQSVRSIQKELDNARAEYNKHNPRHVAPNEVKRRAEMLAMTAARRRRFRDTIKAIEI